MGAERGIDFGPLGLGNRPAMQTGIQFLINLGKFRPEEATMHVAHMVARRGVEFAQTANMSTLLFTGMDPQIQTTVFEFQANHVGKDTGGMLRAAFPADFPREGNVYTFVDAVVANVEQADPALREVKFSQLQTVFDTFVDFYHNTRLVALRMGEKFVREYEAMEVLRQIGAELLDTDRQTYLGQAVQSIAFMEWKQSGGIGRHTGLNEAELYSLYGLLQKNTIPQAYHKTIINTLGHTKRVFGIEDAGEIADTPDARLAQHIEIMDRLKSRALEIFPQQVHCYVEAVGQALDRFYERPHAKIPASVEELLAEEFHSAVKSGFQNLTDSLRSPMEKAEQRIFTYLGTPVADRVAKLESVVIETGSTMTLGKIFDGEHDRGIAKLTVYRMPPGPPIPLESGEVAKGSTCPFFDHPSPRRAQMP